MAGSEIAFSAVLLDIEGTTTPIRFVSDVLFPYARQHGPAFIRECQNDAEIRPALSQLRSENASELDPRASIIEPGSPDVIGRTIEYFQWLIDVDRKSTALKTIQGRIWEQGYKNGDLHSLVFPDVKPAMERWQMAGRIVGIYSSGSVLAQQLLFRHTTEGDLTPLISCYFDTRVGGKKDAASYRAIAQSLKLAASDILFVSDTPSELNAARAAGVNTALCVRPGNSPVPDAETSAHLIVHDLHF
jgi:enolase-phosphatase E1